MIQKFKKFIGSIVGKIYFGYFLLIMAFIVNLIISASIITSNRTKISEFSDVLDPTMIGLNEMKLIQLRSQILIQKWVKSPLYDSEKIDFEVLLDKNLPDTKKKLITLSNQWKSEDNKKLFEELLTLINLNQTFVKNIKRNLSTFEDYQDPSKKFISEDILENNIKVNSIEIEKKMDSISDNFEKLKTISEQEIKESEINFIYILFASSISVVLFGIIFAIYLGNNIKTKIIDFKNVIIKLSSGQIKGIELYKSNDELGDMSDALSKYIGSLNKTANFANQIGNGNFEENFETMGENDELGKSLLAMRNNLKNVKEEEQQRSWSTTGFSIFSEILSRSNLNLTEICDLVLQKLVKYTNSNQGTIFILRNKSHDLYFEQTAVYAFDRKKVAKLRVELKEGLVGQCYNDNDTIYITDVPEEYINIRSGLGDAPPRCILLVPLRLNNDFVGVLEVATFYPYKDFEIKFIEKIGESLGSSLSTIFINENTKNLLIDSEIKGEQLLAQEEEMRQNMEELLATQEELSRNAKESAEQNQAQVRVLESKIETLELELFNLKNNNVIS
ncbi:MAG: GAF domain-containing protein [Cytophagales bacterium]|nr:MAG: GAF domain-containing protein [Cytophagales bacterium]